MTSPSSLSEMKAFVDAEFERRRHIRIVEKELEDFIKDVLVSTSEGMYLWLALQIEALFPLHSTTLLSPSDLLKLLESPPKDLADAFKQALARISDTRYGNKIFQLIATAKRPLTLSKLKVALHVRPGDTDWSSITFSMPQDPRAIISLCGGGLLDLDEEDDAIRFIHHSVSQYLQNHDNQSNPYCFYKYEADIHMGFLCTTYLNYSIFDTSLTIINQTTIQPGQLTNNVARVINSSATKADITSKVIAAIIRRRGPNLQPQGGEEIKIGQLLQRYLNPRAEGSDLMAFSDYAHEHWLWHSHRPWTQTDNGPYRLFKRLLHSTPNHITLPWNLPGEIVDQYPLSRDGELRPKSNFVAPFQRHGWTGWQQKENWLRWALAYRHLGVLLEYLPRTTSLVEDRDSDYGTIIPKIIRLVYKEMDKSRFAVDRSLFGEGSNMNTILEREPGEIFTTMCIEVAEVLYDEDKFPCSSQAWSTLPMHNREEAILALQSLVLLDGHELVDLSFEELFEKRRLPGAPPLPQFRRRGSNVALFPYRRDSMGDQDGSE